MDAAEDFRAFMAGHELRTATYAGALAGASTEDFLCCAHCGCVVTNANLAAFERDRVSDRGQVICEICLQQEGCGRG